MLLNNIPPYLFVMTGLWLVYSVDSLFGFEAGVLLMLVACLIWMRRLEHRQDQPRDTKTRHA